jgi:DNA-binding LytR/AlgR family response regulator
MLKILIIENDYIWQTKIEIMLSAYPQYEIIGFPENASKAIEVVRLQEPDLIISETHLGSDNLLVSLSDLFNLYPTIFICSIIEEDVFQSIIALPKSTLLIKPFHAYSLLAPLFNFFKNSPLLLEVSQYLSFRGLRGGTVRVGFEAIVKIEVEGNYCLCFTSDNKKYVKKVSLKSLNNSLDKSFIRINKATLVNIKFITKIDYSNKIVFVNDEIHQVGRPFYKLLKEIILV